MSTYAKLHRPPDFSLLSRRMPANLIQRDPSVDSHAHDTHDKGQYLLSNQASQHHFIKRLQTKLAVNEPGDRYEQEADRVADQVMRMPEPGVQQACPSCDQEEINQTMPLAGQITPLVQRQEAEPEGEEEEPIQTKLAGEIQRQEEEPEEEKEEAIQTKAAPERTPTVTPKIQAQINTLRGRGRPLSASARAFFEPRFGRDFGQVRIHTGPQADHLVQEVGAKAFTIGSNIAFGAGQFIPSTREGKRLLAHELTHIAQQTAPLAHSKSAGSVRSTHLGSVIQRRRRVRRRRSAASRKWKRVRGQLNIWEARPLAKLEALARRVSRNRRDWMCIRPVRMRYPANPYKNHISPGDTFDVSNLTKRLGSSLNGHELAGAQANWTQHFYGAARFPNAPNQMITQHSDNNRPLRNMLIVAHTNNVRMGRLNLPALNANSPAPTYQRATAGKFPNRCLFTRNARVRAVGCSSLAFGRRFARVYLRPGARITTTRRSVCMGVVRNRRDILRERRTGRVVEERPLPDLYRACFSRNWSPNCHLRPNRLTGWYTTRNSFHKGPYWSNVGGRA